MSQPGEQPQGGENSEAPEKPDGDDAKADGDAKGSKDADSEKQTMPAQTSHQIQMKKQKILNQRMTHPQITQTKAKRQMVTVMVRSSGRRSTIHVKSDRRRTGNHSYRQHSDYEQSMGGGQEHLVERRRRNQTEKPRIVTVRHQIVQVRPRRLH